MNNAPLPARRARFTFGDGSQIEIVALTVPGKRNPESVELLETILTPMLARLEKRGRRK